MKDAVILLLCAVALAQAINQSPDQRSRQCNCDPSQAQQICQANYDNDDVLIAHENCNQFYKCANGKPVAYFCPNDLLYDPFSETCEWSYNVDCGDRPISEGPSKEEDSGSDDVSDVDNDWTCNCNPGEAPSICAAENSNGILVAHQNCNQFYICAEGRPVTMDCSAPLLYNPYNEACDWAHNVECGDRLIPDPKEDDSNDVEDSKENDGTCNCNPEEAPAICAAPGSESELIAHENCNKYYICNHGLPIAVSCFGDLLFNPYTRQCDWPRNVDCGDRLVPETECTGCNDNASNDASCDDDDETPPTQDTQAPPLGPEDSDSSDIRPPGDDVVVPLPPPGTCNCNPEEAPSICAADESSGTLVAHENCNQFYKCDHGIPIVLSCHGDLLYNPYTEQCDWPENVDCGDRVIPDQDDSVSTPGVTNPGETNPGVTNPADTTPGNNCDPSEAPVICAADGSDGVLVAHENCNQFYKCSEGKPVALVCPSNLLFNPATDQCDWPENVDCGDRVIPDTDDSVSVPGVTNPGETNPGVTNPGVTNPADTTPGNNCDPSEAPAICALEDSEGVLVAHENCDQFYKCSGGKPVALICPPNLLFNPAKDQCDWPENVDCGERVIPDPESSGSDSSDIRPPGDDIVVPTRPPGTCNCNPEEAPSICAADDSSGVLIAHENCNQFYKCDHGKPVVLSCYGDLLYNPYTEQCDWPENVDCGDRVIPDPDDSVSTPGATNPGVTNPDVTNPGVTNPGETNPDVTNPAETTPGNNCDPSEAPAICALDDSEGVLVAHENCNQFYMCSGGKPVALICPPNLLFNPAKDQCDWPENVDCGDRVIPDPDDSVSTPGVTNPGETNPGVTNPAETTPGNNCDPSEAPAICASDDSEGVLVAHENCDQFYKCSGGKPVALICPPNLLFNPAKDQCDWPENVDCGERVIPDPESSGSDSSDIRPPGDDVVAPTRPPGTCNCNPEEAPSICAADDSSGVLVAHENCNQFYKCDHGKPVVFTCHGDLLYNPYTEQCDWPENVDCGDRVIPDPDDSVTTPGVTNPGVTNPGVTNPDETNPGVTNPAETTPGNNCDPSEAPAICASDDSEGVLVAHENCDQFYMCSGGKPVALKCPPNLLFNPAKDQCDWPENVDCGERVIPDPESSGSDSSDIRPPGDDVVIPTRPPGTCNCNPEEAPSICAADDSSGVLVAHENCNQFYKCDHGKPVVFTCHGDLLYNPYTEQCDWPENVDCGDRVIPDPDDSVSTPGVTNPGVTNPGDTNPGVTNPAETTPGNNCDPSEAPAICASDDSEGVLVAHENCDQFYMCSGGKPVALICPPNLLFNPAKDQCDWPENVDCGERVVPDPESSGSDSSDIRPPGDDVVVPTRPPGTCNCNPEEAPSICAADDSSGVLIAHENCNQFYKCDHGEPVVFTCHGDLLYNPYTEQCDWPENVDCGDRVIPDPDDSVSTPGVTNPGVTNPGVTNPDETNPGVTNPAETTPGNNCDPSEAPAICALDDSEGVLVAHENCNQFYVCSGGKPVALSCPQNLLFNPAKDQCDWPENVDCGDRVIPDPDDSVSTPGVTNPGETSPGVTNPADTTPGNNCDPSEAPAICEADGSEGVLVAHENCNQFYKCSGGKPVALTCPPNLLFNPNKDQCDWPFNVDCGDRVIPDPEDSEDAEDSDSDTSEIRPPGDGVSPQPPVEGSNEDCSGNSDENGGACNCDPDQAPSICAVDNSDGILIAHENCNQFYLCDNGRPVPFKCPANTLYNPVTQICDWAFNVECGDRIIPDPEDNVTESKEDDSEAEEEIVGPCNCNPEEAPAICAVDGSSGVQIAHENCNQFYICDHGRPVAFSCNGFLLYNPYTERCDWPENVECGDRVIPEPGSESDENDSGDEDNNSNPNDDPSQAPTICAGDGSEGVLVAHENCDQYYICSGGVPVSRPCNDGLLFNPNNQQCDWPSNVVCGDRIVPDDCACNPRNAPALCARPESEGKLVAHENCNQFYICSHSVPVPQSCPASLLYNTDKELCDWPQNVNCENRLLLFSSLNKHWQSRQTLRN